MHNKILNKYYFINKFDKSHIDKQDKRTTIIYRNYNQKIDEKLIIKIKNYCKKKGTKFILSNNIKLAVKLNLDGAYIPSFNKNTKHLSYSLTKKFIISGQTRVRVGQHYLQNQPDPKADQVVGYCHSYR